MENNEMRGHSLFVGKGAVVEATYIPPELPKFSNHPCILSLPRINTRKRAITAMQRFLIYASDPRKLPAHLRTHMAMDLLHFFQPLPVHLRLEGMVSRMIRDGYLARNPIDPAYRGTLKERLVCFKEGRPLESQFEPTASGFSILGMSGVGKSTGMKRVLSLYPQVILHNYFKGRNFTAIQIVWLRLDCPKDASLTALCLEFFRVVDDLLGTNYTKNYGSKAHNLQEMMLFMAIVAAEHFIGVLVIDEIQDLSTAKSGGAAQVLNFFVKLINTIGVPVVIIGTYKAIPIMCSEFRLARRGSGQGDLVWDRMSFDEDWQVFVEALCSLQYVRKQCRMSDRLSSALHDASYGVTDLAIRIYLAAQVRAIETGHELITSDLIRSAYRDDFRLVNRILETLKSGDISPLHMLSDVLPPTIQPIHQPQPKDDKNTQKEGSGSSTLLDKAQSTPKAQGINNLPSKAGPQSVNALSGRDSLVSPFATSARSSKKKPTREGKYEPEDLRFIVLSGRPLNHYDALKEAGYIKACTEFL
jgi:hypothetical protein